MGFVYIIQAGDGSVKIGQTIDPSRRFPEISSKYKVSISDSFISDEISNHVEIESILLKKFREEKSRSDWVNSDFETVSNAAKLTLSQIGKLGKGLNISG